MAASEVAEREFLRLHNLACRRVAEAQRLVLSGDEIAALEATNKIGPRMAERLRSNARLGRRMTARLTMLTAKAKRVMRGSRRLQDCRRSERPRERRATSRARARSPGGDDPPLAEASGLIAFPKRCGE
jgi:hypothetical protein